jgi:hypothetical protein
MAFSGREMAVMGGRRPNGGHALAFLSENANIAAETYWVGI